MKRRVYDSSLPFDDSVPTASQVKDDDSFFRLFGDAFRRNARY